GQTWQVLNNPLGQFVAGADDPVAGPQVGCSRLSHSKPISRSIRGQSTEWSSLMPHDFCVLLKSGQQGRVQPSTEPGMCGSVPQSQLTGREVVLILTFTGVCSVMAGRT